MHSLIEMLKYRRPEGSKTQKKFCKRFLEPIFGKPDSHGNYILHVGESNIMFTAHHDTVHNKDGMQKLTIKSDIVTTDDSNSNCLGADCTTGIWILLGMIESSVPGTYVVFAGEESGCIGSRALLDDWPLWLQDIYAVISFDRRGTESIVTHQCGFRTASDAFAVSLSNALDSPFMRPDDTGVYTDSEVFAECVPECTNISVGYLAQHSSKESQDLFFVNELLNRLIVADWQSLTIERVPEPQGIYLPQDNYKKNNLEELEKLCFDCPEEIASILDSYGITAYDIYEELGISPNAIAI